MTSELARAKVTVQEAADILRCSTKTITEWVKLKLLPTPTRVGRRRLYFDRAAIEAIARDGTPTTTEGTADAR
jgi:excisionase family DNA binding protein